MHPHFKAMYPLSTALGLEPVETGPKQRIGNELHSTQSHPGFDADEVEKAIGAERFKKLMTGIKEVFCCNHRHYPEGHPTMPAGYEVHCIYAWDLENFLAEGN